MSRRIACRAEITDAAIEVKLSVSHPVRLGLDLARQVPDQALRAGATVPETPPARISPARSGEQRRERESARLGDALAEAMVARLVRVSLLARPSRPRQGIVPDQDHQRLAPDPQRPGHRRVSEGEQDDPPVRAGGPQPAAAEEPDRPGLGRGGAPAPPEGGNARRRGRPERAVSRNRGPKPPPAGSSGGRLRSPDWRSELACAANPGCRGRLERSGGPPTAFELANRPARALP